MGLKNLTAKISLVLVFILLTTAAANAEENNYDHNLTVDAEEVWLNEDTAEYTVLEVESEDIEECELKVKVGDGNEEVLELDEDKETVKNMDFKDFEDNEGLRGEKEIVLECGGEDQETEALEFLYLEDFDIVNEDTEFLGYERNSLGDGASSTELEIDLNVEGVESFDTEEMEFDFKGLETFTGVEEGENSYSPRTEETGFYELNLTINTEYTNFTYTYEELNDAVLEVEDAWEVEIIEKGYPQELFLTYDDLRDFSYRLDLTYLGETDHEHMGEVVYEDKFYSEMGGESGEWYRLSESQRNDDDGVYNITLDSRPDVSTGSYELKTYLDVDEGKYKIDNVDVLQSMLFEGQIEDTNNRGVESYMEILDDGIRETIDVGSNGDFSERLDPVTTGEIEDALIYDNIEIGFGDQDDPTSILYASDVNLSDNEGALRYNYEHDANNVEEDGMNPVNKMSLEFGYPLEDPKIRMAFDPERVDPEDVRVFECDNWNFFGQECRTDSWDTIDESDVEIRRGQTYYAEFPAEPYEVPSGDHHEGQEILNSAYVIGTTADLDLNDYNLRISGVEDESVVINDDIEFMGRVIDENSNEIPNADVEIRLSTSDEEYIYEGSTDETGNFVDVEGEAPGSAGQYAVDVTADKDGYNEFSHTYENRLEAYVEEGIRIDFPEIRDTLELTPGEEEETEVTIENIGQKEVEDVTIDLDGDTEYAELDESRFGTIDPESERTLTLAAELPDDFQDSNYPNFDISAEGDSNGEQVDYANTLYTTVVGTVSSEEENETEEETEEASELPESIEEFEQATGEFVASQSSLNLALGLIMVFATVLAAAVKKNNDEDGHRPERDLNRPRIEKPDLSGSQSRVQHVKPENSVEEDIKEMGEDDEVDETIEAIAEEVESDGSEKEEDEAEGSEQEEENEEDSDGFVCSVCGEDFDTESGRKLHEQALH